MKNDKQSITLDYTRYAGFWMRFFAAWIDLILYTILYLGIEYLYYLATKQMAAPANLAGSGKEATDYMSAQAMAGDVYHWVLEVAFIVIATVSYAWFFSCKWQGSPGMHLLRFHICDTQGERISFWHAMVWNVTSIVGLVFCFAGVFYLETRFNMFAVFDILQSCTEQNIDANVCAEEIESMIGISFFDFFKLLYAAAGLALFLCVIWALSIALPKDKTGFHNLICRTRFVKGRPPASGKEVMPLVH